MKIVIPVSSADVHLLSDFAKHIKVLGGCQRQDLIFLPTKSTFSEAQEAAGILQYQAKSVTVIPWDRDNVGVWPYPGNIMWQHAVIEMTKQEDVGNSAPWMFMELDCTFMCPGASDKLEAEHAMSGCKFTGAVVPTRVDIGNGRYITDRNIPGQPENIPHMVGAGIYPANTSKETNGLWRFPKHDLSWDIYLRYVINRSLHATKLIDHHWSTINYKEVNGDITCENDPRNPFGTDHSGTISKEAVMVHGCKDGSLLKIILKKYENTEVVTSASTPSPEPEHTTRVAYKADLPNTGIHYDKAMDRAFKNSTAQTNVIEKSIEKKKRGRPKKVQELQPA